MRRRVFPIATLLGAAMLLGSCSKSTEPQQPTGLSVTPASFTFASLGDSGAVHVRVLDQHGDSIAGVTPTFGTTIAAVATVSATGLVLAQGNGTTSITVSAAGLNGSVPVTVAQVPATLSKPLGDAQFATVGTALFQPLTVRLKDARSNAIAGATVTFAPSAGSVAPTSPTTNASGDAAATWTLGTTSGSQSLTASVGAVQASFTATATPGNATSIAISAGNNQTWAVGAALPVVPTAKVADQYGNGVPNVTVTFAVTGGGGSITSAVRATNVSGLASVGSWTLGAAAGTNTLTATATSIVTPATFTATGTVAGAPKNLVVFGGNSQSGLAGYALNVRPSVRITDANSTPVGNVSVTFAVTAGGGSVVSGTVITNPNGIAQVGNWVMGAGSGAATLTATATPANVTGNPATFSATALAGTFHVTVQNYGPALSAAAQSAFDSAAVHWQRIIYRTLTPASVVAAANACGAGTPAVNQTINDVLILVKLDSIDGPGKILGQAGPCFVRNAPDNHTVLGVMAFDSADVAGMIANGSLNSVILHEMGHVLGFGTLWGAAQFNCLANPSATGSVQDTYFGCPKALAEFDSIGGTSYTGGNKIPVENCGGPTFVPPNCGAGSYNSHWREAVFVNELMSPVINNGANPLSVLTIAAMEDEGYTVNYAAADAYSRVFTAPPALRAAAAATEMMSLGDDILHIPIHVIDRAGRVLRVIQP
jgi:hypothetical protein